MKFLQKVPLYGLLFLVSLVILSLYFFHSVDIMVPPVDVSTFKSVISHCNGGNELPLWPSIIRNRRIPSIGKTHCGTCKPWVYFKAGNFYLQSEHNNAKCQVAKIVRVDDFKSSFSSWVSIKHGDKVPSLGFHVRCADGYRMYSMLHHSVPHLPELEQPEVNASGKDNIIIIGLDSMSRLEALRSLVKSHHFMKEELDGVVLQKYNVVGDGTPAALQPILTGRMEEDWPETRRGYTGANPVDSQDWIFKQMQELGYISLWGEEQPTYGTFQYRMLGFDKSPTTFNLRNTLLVQEKWITKLLCVGCESQSSRMLNNIKELFNLYTKRPKFAFIFLSVLSHDNYDASFHDTEIVEFFKWFKAAQLRKNTTLIFMSDHGQRFGPQRNSMQGKLEERLPLMSISLSEQMQLKQPNALSNLQHNAEVLTTPYDLHKTLHSFISPNANNVLNGSFHWPYSFSMVENQIPQDRSCPDAHVAPHWCACYTGNRLSNPNEQASSKMLAEYAVASINNLIVNHKQCKKLNLSSIISAEIIQFQGSRMHRNSDGSVTLLDNSVREDVTMFLSFKTLPNNGVYEVTITASHSVLPTKYLPGSSISRTNAYGRDPDCIASKFPYLRAFCFCSTN